MSKDFLNQYAKFAHTNNQVYFCCEINPMHILHITQTRHNQWKHHN